LYYQDHQHSLSVCLLVITFSTVQLTQGPQMTFNKPTTCHLLAVACGRFGNITTFKMAAVCSLGFSNFCHWCKLKLNIHAQNFSECILHHLLPNNGQKCTITQPCSFLSSYECTIYIYIYSLYGVTIKLRSTNKTNTVTK